MTKGTMARTICGNRRVLGLETWSASSGDGEGTASRTPITTKCERVRENETHPLPARITLNRCTYLI